MTWAGALHCVALYEFRVFSFPHRAHARVRSGRAEKASWHWLHVGAKLRHFHCRGVKCPRSLATPHTLHVFRAIILVPVNVLRVACSRPISDPLPQPWSVLFPTSCSWGAAASQVSRRPLGASGGPRITRSVFVCRAQSVGGLRSAA